MTRHSNNGLRKICEHPRRQWPKCGHSWHFSYKHGKTHYRFSLDKHAGKHIASKGDAEDLAADIRKAIRAGTFGQVVPLSAMTLAKLADTYLERSVQVKHPDTAEDYAAGLRVICNTPLPHSSGATLPFGAWQLSDIVPDTLARYGEARHAAGAGPGGTNRSLARLRAVFNWGVLVGYCEATPFRRHGVATVTREREDGRSRRLNADTDEEPKLLAACGPHLRAVVECALATGMRSGEILNLTWQQVRGMTLDTTKTPPIVTWAPRSEIVLTAAKTKTRQARAIPLSGRLKSVLEMRFLDPNGQPFASDKYVFGNAIGQRVLHVTRAWQAAVLRSHGHTPEYTGSGNLTAESRAALAEIDLHLHDLRREAGSRWLENGVPLFTVRDWLGHSNISQTSTYLSGTTKTQHDAMRQYEQSLQRLATDDKTGGQEPPQTADTSHERPNENGVGLRTAIM